MTSNIVNVLKSGSEAAGVMNEIQKFKFNPSAIQRVMIGHLRNYFDGEYEIVDPTSPFSMLSDSISVGVAAFMAENYTNNRKQYAVAAQDIEDLYLHMSDKDYIDRFASPARTRFSILIDKEELLSRMVLDPATGIKKVTIPRHTEFYISDTVFSLQYPIDIKQLSHGGLQVVYDTSELSPLQTLETNAVDMEERTLSANQQVMLYLEFDVFQFNINTYRGDLNNATGYNKKLPFVDEFYYARVWFKSNLTNNVWKEMYTTHTDQVYDATKPTAILKVLNNELQVTVPLVYFTSGLVSGSIRVDIYQTKGDVNMVLENYKPSSFEATWKTIEASEETPYVAAMRNVQSVFVYSKNNVYGGKKALSFEQLRDRVIRNSVGDFNLPVTNVQIAASLENKGYEVVKNIDTVTNRAFLATRALPRPADRKLITAGATSIETIVISMAEAIAHPGTRNNNRRITLTPDILYSNENGIVRMVDAAFVQSLRGQQPEVIAKQVSDSKYLYTPFHYVLDATQDSFDVRPYYMDHPVAQTSIFVAQNDTTGLQVNTYRYSLSKLTTGYRLLVETKSNDAYKDIDDSFAHAQLSFVGVNEENRCHLSGTLIGKTAKGERVFEFLIATKFDIDNNDNLWLSNFSMFSAGLRDFAVPLTKDFDIVYSSSSTMSPNWIPHAIDGLLGTFALPNRIAAITQEKLRLKFGVPLKNLWASNRSLPASAPYQVYEQDVYLTYQKDVYEKDPVTGSIFTFDARGDIQYNLVHRVGDVVINQATFTAVLKHRKGDVKLGFDGQPIPSGPNLVTRQIDMMFIEGAYFFATDIASSNYRETVVATVVDWITNDLNAMSANLLEQTKLFFYPKTTMGSVRVMIENGVQTVVEAGQYFGIKLYVNDTVFENNELREAITVKTVEMIDAQLKSSTVSISTMTSALRDVYKDDVIAFTISGLGGARNLQMFTILDESERCSIRKRLTALPDGKLIVQEDVMVDFIRHSQTQTQ